MDAIDIAITQYLNSFVGTSVRLDRIILEVLQLNTMKMMPMVAVMVWLWFSGSQLNTRKAVFSGFAGGFIALVLTRLIQNLAPHRPRPALDASLNFSLPTGGYTNDWSSFPSDTAGLAFAMALGIWLASRRLGILGFLWATFVISFPRLYGGYHYMSDLLAGAVIGMASTYVFWRWHRISDPLFDTTMTLHHKHAPWFYALAFVVAFQTSTYFGDIRSTGQKLLHSIGAK